MSIEVTRAPAPGSDIAYVDPTRRALSRKRAQKNALTGILSLFGFLVVVGFFVSRTPGWAVVQETFFNGEEFVKTFPGLLEAFLLNVRIFLIAEPLILFVGFAVAFAVLGPVEVLRQAQIDTSSSFNYTPYVGAALIFILLTIPMTRFADWIQSRTMKQRRLAGTS